MKSSSDPSKKELKLLYPFTVTPIPQKFMKCIISRKIFHPEEYIENVIKPKLPKDEQLKKKLERGKERKQKSNMNVKSNTLYLSMLLLLWDPTAQITFEPPKCRFRRNNAILMNYRITSIISEGKEIYGENLHYIIEEDEEHGESTIKFDEETGFPLFDKKSKRNYNVDERIRIQQHILIQTINKVLKQYDKRIDYEIMKSSTINVSSIKINSFFDCNEKGEFIQIDKNKMNENIYKNICDYFFNFILYFINNKTSKTLQLVVGDLNNGTNEYNEFYECTTMGRQIVINSLWYFKVYQMQPNDYIEMIKQYILYQQQEIIQND